MLLISLHLYGKNAPTKIN